MELPPAVQKISDEVENHFKESDDPSKKPALEVVAEPGKKEAGAKNEPENWELRFKNYKTTTDQTITSLRTELVTAQQKSGQDDARIADLGERLQTLESAAAKVAETPANNAAKEFDINLLPEDMRNTYEPEYLKNLVAIVQQVHGTGNDDKIILELKQQLDDLKGMVQTTKENDAKSALEKYYEVLDKEQPNWVEIGEMPEFTEFLTGKVNELLPQTYGDVLAAADQQNDATKVLSVIAAYQQAGGKIDNGTGLEGQVTLDGGAAHGGDGSDLQPADQKLTEEQITQFNLDVTKGVYKDKPEDRAAIEAIIKAQYSAGPG